MRESLLLALSVAMFLVLRSRRWEWAAAAGFAAGLVRPAGILLAVPALVEAVRDSHAIHAPRAIRRALPVIAPVLGTLTYLAWAEHVSGEFLSVPRTPPAGLRGPTVDPITNLAGSVADLFHGHAGAGLHVVAALVFVALVVRLVFVLPRRTRRMPRSRCWSLQPVTTSARSSATCWPRSRSSSPLRPSSIGPGPNAAVVVCWRAVWSALSILTFTGVFVP